MACYGEKEVACWLPRIQTQLVFVLDLFSHVLRLLPVCGMYVLVLNIRGENFRCNIIFV